MVYDTATLRLVKRIPVGRQPIGLSVPNSTFAYVAAMRDNLVAEIDLQRLEVSNVYATGNKPDGLTGLDHGVGHFRPLSITRQRHWLACHLLHRDLKVGVKYVDNFYHCNPLNFKSLINPFYFNTLREKEEKSNSCTNMAG